MGVSVCECPNDVFTVIMIIVKRKSGKKEQNVDKILG